MFLADVTRRCSSTLWNRNLNNNITVTDSEAYLNPQREFQAQQRHNEIMYQMQQDRIQRIRAEHDAIL